MPACNVQAGPRQHRDRLRGVARRHASTCIPEYLGTIDLEILRKRQAAVDLHAMHAATRSRSASASRFRSASTTAMRSPCAPPTPKRLGIKTLSDLARHPQLRLGLSNEFIGRADGWPGLAARYGLAQQPAGLDHGLAYEALAGGSGGRDRHLHHRREDRAARPARARRRRQLLSALRRGRAVPARRAAALSRRRGQALQQLEGRIDEAAMIAMNARAELRRRGLRSDRARLPGRAARPRTAPRGWSAKLFGDRLARD